jgi:hypothetical protein
MSTPRNRPYARQAQHCGVAASSDTICDSVDIRNVGASSTEGDTMCLGDPKATIFYVDGPKPIVVLLAAGHRRLDGTPGK